MTYRVKKIVWLVASLPFIMAFETPIPVSIQASSTISLKGTSTLHDFECSTKTIEGTIEIDHTGYVFTSANISIPVYSLHSSSASMDDNMYDALKAKQYPKIQFSLLTTDSTQLVRSGTTDSALNLRGNLTIAGKQKLIDLPAYVVKHENGTITVHGIKKLLMTDFGIDPPTFMLGVLKTGNEVTIEFSLDLKESNSQVHAIMIK